jgi:outer membrane lipoprotein-sorting protein
MAAQANPDPLPPTTPAALIADMHGAQSQGFSGTIVAQMSLGLPSLPGIASSDSDASMTSLLAGSHTLRCWYGGPDQQRVALLGTTDETDVFHSGADLWQWDSSRLTATHVRLPAHTTHPLAPPTIASLTPQQLAAQALAALDPSTAVTVDGTRVVADRSAYVLVLTPRDDTTRVGSVRISVDGATKVPLGVQIFARGTSSPAVDIEFSHVSFSTPSEANFSFVPPPDATVRQGFGSADDTTSTHPAAVIGTGWSSVVEAHAASSHLASLGTQSAHVLPQVSGSWGKGRLLDATLFSVLLTDDGRIFAGAVAPDVLYRAAATHK